MYDVAAREILGMLVASLGCGRRPRIGLLFKADIIGP